MSLIENSQILLDSISNGAIPEDKLLQIAELGIDPNYAPAGYSLLHWAASRGRKNLCEKLLELGADLKKKSPSGENAVNYAATNNYPELAGLLKDWQPSSPLGWKKFNDTGVAEICIDGELKLKLTHVFNFQSREKITIAENLNTKSIGVSPAESFDTIGEERLRQAFDAYREFKPDLKEEEVFRTRLFFK